MRLFIGSPQHDDVLRDDLFLGVEIVEVGRPTDFRPRCQLIGSDLLDALFLHQIKQSPAKGFSDIIGHGSSP